MKFCERKDKLSIKFLGKYSLTFSKILRESDDVNEAIKWMDEGK